ncbi:MAG TPA: asparagine synthase-related protein, partial [Clostridia bacterium]|nr:asparagine synthase-related protein [Clostridia bacterium]
SEIKALLVFPGVGRNIRSDRVYEYLRNGSSDGTPETMFDSVRQLPPGHYVSVPLDAAKWPEPEMFWAPVRRGPLQISFEEAAKTLRELFLESVRFHLRSDVPIGACLSGGIDSSAIVRSMREVGGSALDLHTFTYAEADVGVGEEKWADVVNREAGAMAHKVRLGPDQLQQDFERLIAAQDEPFLSTSIYAQHCVFRAARDSGMVVMLDGQGADEILGGYWPLISARIASLLQSGSFVRAWRLFLNCSKLPGARKGYFASRTGAALIPRDWQRGIFRLLGRAPEPVWMNAKWFRDRNAASNRAIRPSSNGNELLKTALERMLVETSLPCLLRYEDRNSMAFSIESRVPFLTPAIVDFVYALPEDYIIGEDATTKRVFRAAMRGLVPDVILDRRDKIGFATADFQWFVKLRPWVEGVLDSETARSIPVIDSDRILKRFRSGIESGSFDEGLWRCLNLIEWSRQYGVQYN